MKAQTESPLFTSVKERLDHLVPRIQQLPPSGARPLVVSGFVAGWISAGATQVLAALPGVRVDPEAVYISADGQVQGRSLSQLLAGAANALQEAGSLRAWRDELLDVIGEGRTLGVIERAAVRPLGLLTKAVHLNAWTPDGRLWIARRSASKSTDPGLWDTLVGGLAVAGESLDLSLLRESHEEAGLTPENLQARSTLRIILRMHRRLPEGYQVEDVLVSECVIDESVPMRNLDGEVDEIRAASLEDVWQIIHEGGFTLEAELVVLDSLLRRFS